MKVNGFCDLNICVPLQQLHSYTDKLLSMGYKTIALNTIVEEEPCADSGSSKKKKKGQVKDAIPVPQRNLQPEVGSGKLKLLQRLTVCFSEADQLQKLCKSDVAKQYDIISVIPKTSNAFQLACACKDIDLISFDASERISLMNRKLYNLAVSNGIYFEVPYAPAISDSGKRKATIQVAHLYHLYGKSKNIVITSGARDISKVRGPYDIINLVSGLILGLSEGQARHSMSNTSRALILRAEGRRFGKTVMTMRVSDQETDSEESDDSEPAVKKTKTVTEYVEEMSSS